MAVRFLPEPGHEDAAFVPDRVGLAEVIDLRARLVSAASHRVDRASVESFRAEPSHAAEVRALPFPEGEPASGLAPEQAALVAATRDAVRLLARRARSSGELARELGELEHAPDAVEGAVAEAHESLYLDDVGLARGLAESLRARKRSSRAQIRQKLRDRLIPSDIIERVLAELDDDEEDELLCEAATQRALRLRGLDHLTAERRLLGFLARRGWSGEPARRAARDALRAAGHRPSFTS